MVCYAEIPNKGLLVKHLKPIDLKADEESVMLTDKFLSASNLIYGYADIDTAEKKLVFFEYSTLNPEWKGDNAVYSMLNNSEYTAGYAIKSLESLVTDDYFEVLKDNGGEFFGCDIDIIAGTEKGENPPMFKEFSGDMYYIQRNGDIPVFKNSPQITEENTSDFIVSRKTDKEYLFHIIWNGSEWLICDIERKKNEKINNFCYCTNPCDRFIYIMQ